MCQRRRPSAIPAALLALVPLLALVASSEPRCRVIPVEPPGCEAILLEDVVPGVYPPRYRAPTENPNGDQLSAFRSWYGLAFEDYMFDVHPETWAYDIRHILGRAWLAVDGVDVVDAGNVVAVTRAFLDRWQALLGAEGLDLAEDRVRCASATACWIRLRQEYCGLPLVSGDPVGSGFDGTILVRFRAGTNQLDSVDTALVPLLPVPVTPAVSAAQLAEGLVGHRFPYSCGGPPLTAEVLAAADVHVADGLEIVIAPAPDDRRALEYRTAWHAIATAHGPDGSLDWDVWVDAFTGELLRASALFDCN